MQIVHVLIEVLHEYIESFREPTIVELRLAADEHGCTPIRARNVPRHYCSGGSVLTFSPESSLTGRLWPGGWGCERLGAVSDAVGSVVSAV